MTAQQHRPTRRESRGTRSSRAIRSAYADFSQRAVACLEVSSLEVGRDDKDEVLWCKIHRSEDEPTHGGGYLFTVAYLDRTLSQQSE